MAKYIDSTMEKIYRILGTSGWYSTVFVSGMALGALIAFAIR